MLYNEGVYHIIKLFSNIECIKDSVYYRKLINIGIGGKWEADAINYFQDGLHKGSLANPELLFALLGSYSNAKIQSFFYFFFDGIHPPFEEIPAEFKSLKPKYPGIYQQMEKAFHSALSGSRH